MRTFAELDRDSDVTAREVAEVLEHYAASGSAISAAVVVGLIRRTNPDQLERKQMKASAQKGRDDQGRRRFAKDAEAYNQVIRHLSR